MDRWIDNYNYNGHYTTLLYTTATTTNTNILRYIALHYTNCTKNYYHNYNYNYNCTTLH